MSNCGQAEPKATAFRLSAALSPTPPTAISTAIELRSVTKVFQAGSAGSVTALDEVSLAIRDNEFFTLLGPSGCGKTTLLRLIAGFEQVTQGNILLFGDDVAGLPPHKRPINTVFQHYALFPHMTVAENVAFGLRMLRRDKAEIRRTVETMLTLVKMPELADRKSSQLSGGQQQRVALTRALANHPRVLLLDEPLSALDLKLRQEMRLELKTLQRETGITFIFVTHDQEEALTMSDRIAVLQAGRIQQVGTPDTIYEQPANSFVANFMGETNLLPAVLGTAERDMISCLLEGGAEVLAQPVGNEAAGSRVTLSLRPERIVLSSDPGTGLAGRITDRLYRGTDTSYRVKLEDGPELLVYEQNVADRSSGMSAGNSVGVLIAPGAARILVG